jgi:Flp pilus assembly protein TadG
MPSHIRSFRNVLNRFRRNRRGATVVEFALVAPMFFALLFAIIETAFMFFASQVLETVTQDSARLIQTGRAQTGPYTAAQFKADVCARITVMFDCVNGISVDVQSYPSFASINVANPIDAGKNFTNPNNYSPGDPGDIVVVRLFYQYPVYVSLLGFNLSNITGGKRLLAATAAFRNEPYSN